MRVYLDSVLIIYLVEQNPQFAPAVENWLVAHPCDLVSSELARMECLVVLVRNNDAARVADFESFFQTRVSEIVPLGRAVFDRVIQIRIRSRFKTPDSIHLAAAVEAGCDVFLTNDLQLKQFTGIAIEVI